MFHFTTGRASNSPVITELTYSLSNLLILFNDQIIAQASTASAARSCTPASNHTTNVRNGSSSSASTTTAGAEERRKRRLQLLLTTLEYCEVFVEMSARQLWDERGRWFVCCCVQLAKWALRLLLRLRHGERVVSTPACRPLDRKELLLQQKQQAGGAGASAAAADDGAFGANVNATFELRRSGRRVRCVEGAPPPHLRTWLAPEVEAGNGGVSVGDGQYGQQASHASNRELTLAECVYICRPLVHLGGCGLWGLDSWRSYALALAMDAGR